jgi:hypothetical protein
VDSWAFSRGRGRHYVERREAALPQSTTGSTPASTTGTTVTGRGRSARQSERGRLGAGRRGLSGAHAAAIGRNGESERDYTILSPSDQPMTVRETREVRLNGELVANPAVDVVRQTGTYSSALPITLPPNARTGRYEVTVTVTSGDRQSTSTTSFSAQ